MHFFVGLLSNRKCVVFFYPLLFCDHLICMWAAFLLPPYDWWNGNWREVLGAIGLLRPLQRIFFSKCNVPKLLKPTNRKLQPNCFYLAKRNAKLNWLWSALKSRTELWGCPSASVGFKVHLRIYITTKSRLHLKVCVSFTPFQSCKRRPRGFSIMDTGSVVSEPISAHHRAFAKQKSASMVSSLD